jgi:hypothetical protein
MMICIILLPRLKLSARKPGGDLAAQSVAEARMDVRCNAGVKAT